VTGNGTYLDIVFIHRHERQSCAIVPTRRAAVVGVKSILQAADFGDREMVARQDVCWGCSHLRASVTPFQWFVASESGRMSECSAAV
jgi:hypothetical protein